MDQIIDKKIIKKLREKRLWSQDHLASVSGLSPRTIQRIEKEGRCSLESKKALAAVFEVDASDFNYDTVIINSQVANNRDRKLGILGATMGMLFAYVGITLSLVEGHISYGEAGLYYGVVGASCGICCAIIGFLSNRYKVGAS